MEQKQKNKYIKQFLNLFEDSPTLAIEAIKQYGAPNPQTVRGAEQHSNEQPIIKIRQLGKQYRLNKQDVYALKEVNIDIYPGEFVAITGPSGSGKSTLLHIMAGLDKPSSGEIFVNNLNLNNLNDRRLSEYRSRVIGFVFQFFYLQPFLDVLQNVEVPGMFARTSKKIRKESARLLLTNVELNERIAHLPKELSGGQMQRTAIARALLNQPPILLADEPTGNLDGVSSREIFALFDKIRHEFGTTIVVVTHDNKLASYADRVINIEDGQVA